MVNFTKFSQGLHAKGHKNQQYFDGAAPGNIRVASELLGRLETGSPPRDRVNDD